MPLLSSLRCTALSYLEGNVTKRLADRKAASNNIPTSTKVNVNHAIDVVLDCPESRRSIEEYIGEFAEQTLASRAAFEQISRLLRLFDSKKFKTKDDHPIPVLRPQWDMLRKVS